MANLAAVNQALGRKDTDELLRAFGRGLVSVSHQYPEALAARLNCADFALLVPALASPQDFAQQLFQALTREAAAYLQDRPSTWLGCGHFPPGVEVETILSQVDMALAAVEADGASGMKVVSLHVADEVPKSTEEWALLIHLALDQKWVRLVSFPAMSLDGKLLHRECPLRLMFDEHGEWQPAGKFLPVAERLKSTPQLDLAAVALGLDELEPSQISRSGHQLVGEFNPSAGVPFEFAQTVAPPFGNTAVGGWRWRSPGRWHTSMRLSCCVSICAVWVASWDWSILDASSARLDGCTIWDWTTSK